MTARMRTRIEKLEGWAQHKQAAKRRQKQERERLLEEPDYLVEVALFYYEEVGPECLLDRDNPDSQAWKLLQDALNWAFSTDPETDKERTAIAGAINNAEWVLTKGASVLGIAEPEDPEVAATVKQMSDTASWWLQATDEERAALRKDLQPFRKEMQTAWEEWEERDR